tara:strand:+ start:1425 stop:1919 length:495 start_codon:yes stop_codon:yes gene_type:complete
MCLKAIEEMVMAPAEWFQGLFSTPGGGGGGGAVDTSATDAGISSAKAAANAEAARLAKITQERNAAPTRALATEAEKKRQTELAATITAKSPATSLPSTVGSTTPTGNAETAIPTVATQDITSPSTQKKLSESLLQRLSKRGGTGRRSLISGSSGGLGFYSRFS